MQKRWKNKEEPAQFGIVVYDGVEPIDIGGTIGVVSMARRVLPRIGSVTIAETPGTVKLAGGLAILADYGFDNSPTCDRFVVCGGPGWREQVNRKPMLGFLRSKEPSALASVCTGALILAASGALDGRTATTRRAAVGGETTAPLEFLRTLARDVRTQAAAIVDDRGLVTGGGVSLAIDCTLYLIGEIYGPSLMEEVARVIEYDRAYATNATALPHLRLT